jgi:hypothetical protein
MTLTVVLQIINIYYYYYCDAHIHTFGVNSNKT